MTARKVDHCLCTDAVVVGYPNVDVSTATEPRLAGPKRVLTIIDSEDRHLVALARRTRWDGRNYPSPPDARKRRKMR